MSDIQCCLFYAFAMPVCSFMPRHKHLLKSWKNPITKTVFFHSERSEESMLDAQVSVLRLNKLILINKSIVLHYIDSSLR